MAVDLRTTTEQTSIPATAEFIGLEGTAGSQTIFRIDAATVIAAAAAAASGPTYSTVADGTALAALTGMSTGDWAYQTDKSSWFTYNGTAWVEVGSPRAILPDAANAAAVTALAASANEGDIVRQLDTNTWYVYDTGVGWRELATQAATGSYNAAFLTAGWTGSAITVTGATHGQGTHPFVRVYDAAGAEQSVGINVNFTSGDVTLSVTPGFEFDGTVVITA